MHVHVSRRFEFRGVKGNGLGFAGTDHLHRFTSMDLVRGTARRLQRDVTGENVHFLMVPIDQYAEGSAQIDGCQMRRKDRESTRHGGDIGADAACIKLRHADRDEANVRRSFNHHVHTVVEFHAEDS